MINSSGRVSELNFKIVCGACFGLAIVVAGCRILLRVRLNKRLQLDDYLVLSACSSLTASTGILYRIASSIFFLAKLVPDQTTSAEGGIPAKHILHELGVLEKLYWVFFTLSWITIFMIKYGFLAFFRNLVDRLPRENHFWKGVVVITSITLIFAICDSFIVCPHFGHAAHQCTVTHEGFVKSLAVPTTNIVLDMFTDILILAIPIWLLWRVQIEPTQKLGIAAFLCLSICTILIAITRFSGRYYHGKYDNSWIILWQHIEACAAVIILSLTAFRSMFVVAKPGPNKARRWVPSTARLLARRRKKSILPNQRLDDLSIPSATLTGLSGAFGRDKPGHSLDDENITTDTLPLSIGTHHETQIHPQVGCK